MNYQKVITFGTAVQQNGIKLLVILIFATVCAFLMFPNKSAAPANTVFIIDNLVLCMSNLYDVLLKLLLLHIAGSFTGRVSRQIQSVQTMCYRSLDSPTHELQYPSGCSVDSWTPQIRYSPCWSTNSSSYYVKRRPRMHHKLLIRNEK